MSEISINAMQNFAEHHQLNINFSSNGNGVFMAKINYSKQANTLTSFSEVSLIRNGYNDGAVKINETKELNINSYHLDFSHEFQEFKFDTSTKELVIKGSSQKMSGEYIVKIIPRNV